MTITSFLLTWGALSLIIVPMVEAAWPLLDRWMLEMELRRGNIQ